MPGSHYHKISRWRPQDRSSICWCVSQAVSYRTHVLHTFQIKADASSRIRTYFQAITRPIHCERVQKSHSSQIIHTRTAGSVKVLLQRSACVVEMSESFLTFWTSSHIGCGTRGNAHIHLQDGRAIRLIALIVPSRVHCRYLEYCIRPDGCVR